RAMDSVEVWERARETRICRALVGCSGGESGQIAVISPELDSPRGPASTRVRSSDLMRSPLIWVPSQVTSSMSLSRGFTDPVYVARLRRVLRVLPAVLRSRGWRQAESEAEFSLSTDGHAQ